MVTLQEAVKDYHAKHQLAVKLQIAWMDARASLARMRTPFTKAAATADERAAHEAMVQARAAATAAWVVKENLKARIARASA